MKRLLAGAVALAVASTAATAWAQSYDRRVQIVNATSETMMYFYASTVDAPTWEEDILGDSVLPAGNSVVMNIDDGSGYCRYDFRAVFADGTEAIQAGVNVCEVATFTFHE
ncbi:hypothetical protein [Pelagibacterium sp. H642]|uniref:hypothetical protein n=1 Tax=Pelagibacterium sp. H642 TaxID=1881069 RepID=UPI0028163085|nr:hypothetical protein [Pelagibacterium sp. H642]WMT91300.1 hypothetical protein NO934_03300 [Pelagibacterium sp. H642]